MAVGYQKGYLWLSLSDNLLQYSFKSDRVQVQSSKHHVVVWLQADPAWWW